MSKKILCLLTVVVMAFSILSVSASALIDTTIIYGDFNGDKKTDLSDASEILKVAAGLANIKDGAVLKRCDVNGDGVVTIFDARQVLRSVANLAGIQPTGAFTGFTGNGIFASADDAVKYFNTGLNRIKQNRAGFTRSETADVRGFNIADVSLSGIVLGESASSVAKMIEEMIVSESEPEATQISIKGDNCDNAMSVETENYVSNLSAKEVLGVKCTQNKEAGTVTIQIAVPDCELDNVSQSAIGDVLNATILQENMNTVVGNVFGTNAGGDATRKTIKNCVLTATFDTTSGNAISYVTAYETETYIANSTLGLNGGILSADLRGVEYDTAVSVIYDHIQW